MQLVSRLRRGASPSVARALLVGTAGTIGLNVGTTVLNLATTVALTRVLGASGYGAYAFAVAWALVLTALAGLGLSPGVVRYVASYVTHGRYGELRGLLRSLHLGVGSASVVTVVPAALVGVLALDAPLRRPFLLALTLVPLLALTALRQSVMQGLHRVLVGRVPETIVAPGGLLVLVLAVWATRDGLSPGAAVVLQLAATVAAFAVGWVLLARALPAAVRSSAAAFEVREWTRSALPLVALGVLLAASAQVGTIVLGALASPAEAGVFAVAARAAAFVGFVALAATYPLMPAVARLDAEGELDRLRSTVSRAATALFALTLPIAVAVVAFAGPVLGVFGDEFGSGAHAVRILVVAELIKAGLGLGGLALVMTGHETRLVRGVAVGTALYVVLAIVLVPPLGVEGAALASVAGAVGGQTILCVDAWRILRVVAVPFSRPARAGRRVDGG